MKKKEDPTHRTNYRPNCVLSLLSKVFGTVMYEQIYEYLNSYLYDLLCGSRKVHSTQYVLFRLITLLKKVLDNPGSVETILMDL